MLPSRAFVADRGDARTRLDHAIVRRLSEVPHLSRTRVQRWIDEGLVLVNGRRARRAAAAVAAGDRVEVLADEARAVPPKPAAEAIEVEVLYQDEHLLAIDKPPGIVVHPTYKHTSGTLLNALLWRFGEGDVIPRFVSRLDRDTSGVLLVALSADVHARLQRASAHGNIRKEYLAVVAGRPRKRAGTIALPLGRDPGDRRRVTVQDRGRESVTRYEVLGFVGGVTLLRCELVTGRTHQIRVHLAASGWPIVGDRVYGRASSDISRQALHAWRLTLSHPISERPLVVTAPVPADIRVLGAGLVFPNP